MNSGIPFVEQLTGLHFLRTNETAVTKSLGRLTTGLRITTAADDPSGNAIANLHDAQVRGSNTAIHNVQDGISLLRTALSGILEIEENVLYARDLAVRAFYDSSLTTEQKQRMQDVIDGILDNIDTIANNTTFLGIPILNGGTGTAYTIDTQVQWQAGYTDNPVGSIDTVSVPGDIELAGINTIGEYYSGAMDMGTAGGTGSLSWNSTEPAGTSIQMMVQESATGLGGWTDLGYMTNGRSFDYSNRYLRIVAELNTLDIVVYGSPAIHDATITKLEPAEVQAGPDNNIYQIVDLAAIDARTAALGIAGFAISGLNFSLDDLDYAIVRLDRYRRAIATVLAELQREIESNTNRALFEGNASDRLRLANLPDEIVKLARADVATTGAAEMLNLTNDRIFENANTLLGNNAHDGADFLAVDMQSLLSRILPEYAQRLGPKMFIKL